EKEADSSTIHHFVPIIAFDRSVSRHACGERHAGRHSCGPASDSWPRTRNPGGEPARVFTLISMNDVAQTARRVSVPGRCSGPGMAVRAMGDGLTGEEGGAGGTRQLDYS